MAAYRDTIRDRIRPHARDDEHVGLTWLADGDDVYDRMIRYHTTLELIGPGDPRDRARADREARRRVPRARARRSSGTSDVPEIFRRLRDDPALHHTNGADIVDRVEGRPRQGDRRDGRLVRDPAEGRLRRRGGPVRRDRLLLPAGQGRLARRRVLHEHLGPERLGPLPDRGDLLPRGRSRATTSSSRSRPS